MVELLNHLEGVGQKLKCDWSKHGAPSASAVLKCTVQGLTGVQIRGTLCQSGVSASGVYFV